MADRPQRRVALGRVFVLGQARQVHTGHCRQRGKQNRTLDLEACRQHGGDGMRGRSHRVDFVRGVRWSRRISEYTGVEGDISRSTPAVHGDLLVLGNLAATPESGAWLVGVEASTGALRWRTKVDGEAWSQITGSVVVDEGGLCGCVVAAFGDGGAVHVPRQCGGARRGHWSVAVAEVHGAGRVHRWRGVGQHPGGRPATWAGLRGHRAEPHGARRSVPDADRDRMRQARNGQLHRRRTRPRPTHQFGGVGPARH